MGCMAYTEPQCLYKDALYPYLLPYKVRLPDKEYSRVLNILNIDVEIVSSMVIHFDTIFTRFCDWFQYWPVSQPFSLLCYCAYYSQLSQTLSFRK
jgi:hypothetical protein